LELTDGEGLAQRQSQRGVGSLFLLPPPRQKLIKSRSSQALQKLFQHGNATLNGAGKTDFVLPFDSAKGTAGFRLKV